MSASLPSLSPAQLSRYSRHILLEEIGVTGQQRLAAARVLVVGAGGLGSPAALYLAAAGVGTLGIADWDQVELHNLQRQLLHDTGSVGEPKVASAARRLHAINPHVELVTHADGILPEQACEIFGRYDVIVDGTDNFTSRYVNNDAAFAAGKPLVFGSVFKFEGQVTVFDPARGGPCYRCLFPEPPLPGSVPGCGEAGVLGALCGVIGSLQALETIKLITAVGEPLIGRLLTYDGLTQRFETLAFRRDPACPLCGDTPRDQPIASRAAAAPASAPVVPSAPADIYPPEVSVSEARHRLEQDPAGVMLLDVREPWETQICQLTGSELIPMRQIPARSTELPKDRHILVLCHHGARSQTVSDYLRAQGFERVSNIAGGIDAWSRELDPTVAQY